MRNDIFNIDSENTHLREVILYSLAVYFFDLAALPMLSEQQFYLFGQIHTSQTGGQMYSYTSPYGECSLINCSSVSIKRASTIC